MGDGEALFLHGKSGMDDFDQFQDAQTKLSDNVQVLSGIFINGMVGVFPECNVQMPMHDFYGPMLARSPAEKRNVRFQTADEEEMLFGKEFS